MEIHFSGGTCNFSLTKCFDSQCYFLIKIELCLFIYLFIWDRNQDGYDFAEFSEDEEMEEENMYYRNNNNNNVETVEENYFIDDKFLGFEKEVIEESCSTDEEESIYSSVLDLESIYHDEVEVKEMDDDSDSDSVSYCYSQINKAGPTSSLPKDSKTNGSTNMIDKDINHGLY